MGQEVLELDKEHEQSTNIHTRDNSSCSIVEKVEIDDDNDDNNDVIQVVGDNVTSNIDVQSCLKRSNLLQSESIPPPFSLSWASDINCDDLSNKKETLYRRTLAELFEKLIPYMEQAYETTLTKTLYDAVNVPGYQIPSRMQLLSQVTKRAVNQIESVANRHSVKRRKNNNFLTKDELLLLAEDAMGTWQSANDTEIIRNTATYDSPLSNIDKSSLPVLDSETVVHSISDEPESDPIKVIAMNELPVEDIKVTRRRIKRDFDTLKSRDDTAIGPTILENLECRVCFRFFKDIDDNEALRAERSGDVSNLSNDEDISMKYQIETSKCTMGGLWTTPCGHIFCNECLRDYFMGIRGLEINIRPTKKQVSTKKPCPTCKYECRYSECHKIYI